MQIDSTTPIRLEAFANSGSNSGVKPAKSQATATEPSTAAKTRSPEPERASRELEAALQPFNVSLKFSKDEDTGTIVVQIVDDKSGQTLQQFPSEAMLHVAAILGKLQGNIFDHVA